MKKSKKIKVLVRLAKKHKLGIGVPMNDDKAFKLFKKAAALGDSDATWYVARAYYDGYVVKQSIKKAIRYYELVAPLGYGSAFTNLGVHYWETGGKINRAKAIYYYRQAEKLGEPYAIYNLGLCLSKGHPGIGISKNKKKAFAKFLAAAKLGHVESQYKVGWHFLNGRGTKKNVDKAKKWLKLAAKREHYEAGEILDYLSN